MTCWLPFICALAISNPVVFPVRPPEQILRRVPLCETRLCCLYQATLSRMKPGVYPYDSGALEAQVLDVFLDDREEIELSCPKVGSR